MVRQAKILIVDDEGPNRTILHEILKPIGYIICEAADGEEAIKQVEREKPDLILLDVVMPKLDGYEVCRILKSSHKTKLIPIIMLTSLDLLQDKLRAVDLGSDDFLNKPFNLAELTARVKALIALKQYTDELEYAFDVLKSIALIVESRDAYTHNHCKNVEMYSEDIAKKIGLSGEEIATLKLGAAYHDIGKIAISDLILQKPGKLTPVEMEIMKTHTTVGAELLKPMHTLEKALPLIRSHHERLDGSGYPDGLKAQEISQSIRILSVADIYEALISKRSYKEDMPHEKAIKILTEEGKKGWWDKDIITLLDEVMRARLRC
jgi:putative two-component system response regulator